MLIADIILLIVSLWVSFSLRLGEWYNPFVISQLTILDEWKRLSLFLAAPVIAIPIFVRFGLYRAIIRYLGIKAALSVIKAVALYSILWGLLAFLSEVPGIPRSVVFINGMVSLLMVGGIRIIMRRLLEGQRELEGNDQSTVVNRVVIYGAGEEGRQLAMSLFQSRECRLIGFVDHNIDLQGRDLLGVPVISIDVLSAFVELHRITDLLLAIPSITRKERNKIIEQLRLLPLRIRTLPVLTDLVRGDLNFSDLNELDVDDLLAREPVNPDEALLKSQVRGQVVLVTGAGGSIGSEICLQVLNRFPKVLLLLEFSEYALYNVNEKLSLVIEQLKAKSDYSQDLYVLPRVVPLLGSVQDKGRLRELVKIWKPKLIYHAAAYKHVPLVEENIIEGIKNNVFGTLAVAEVAIEQEVSNVVLISTDKAVRPTNIMGCSKRIAEMILQALMAEDKIIFELVDESLTQALRNTHFSMVRFGNVLGSSGSVVPLFRKQILNGGPITLTDREIIRYFMTITEAAQLVMHAGSMHEDAKRNNHFQKREAAEVFVLNMGEPVKIYDLAKRMVELSGLQIKDESCPNGDIEIQITGLRPGEKLYEELLIGGNSQPTKHPRIFTALEEFIPWSQLQLELNTLRGAVEKNDIKMVHSLIQKLVKGYQPKKKIVGAHYRE